MRRTDFTAEPHGQLVPTIHGQLAFVPGPLPPPFQPTADIMTALAQAERMIGRLHAIIREAPDRDALVRPMLRREATLSSQIEGTQATVEDLYAEDAEHTADARAAAVAELSNNERALTEGLRRRQERPISKNLLRELHAVLMEGVRGGDRDPGAFRRIQNWIGPPGCDIADATYVPPPPQEVLSALDALEGFIHTPSDLPDLIRLAMIHYQFEAIHPFIDGNGRIGRLLITLLMVEWNVLEAPPVDLSTYLKRNQSDYYRLLLRVTQQGDWSAWIAFFLRGMAEQASEVYARARMLLSLRRELLDTLRQRAASQHLEPLVGLLLRSPILTVRQIESHLGVTYRTANRLVRVMVESDVLRERTGRRRNRVFEASRVLDAIAGPVRNIETD